MFFQVTKEEQRNKELETQWKLLQEQSTASPDIEPTMKTFLSTMERKLAMVLEHKSKLEQEKDSIDKSVEDFKKK